MIAIRDFAMLLYVVFDVLFVSNEDIRQRPFVVWNCWVTETTHEQCPLWVIRVIPLALARPLDPQMRLLMAGVPVGLIRMSALSAAGFRLLRAGAGAFIWCRACRRLGRHRRAYALWM
jgi:hypothetical protein